MIAFERLLRELPLRSATRTSTQLDAVCAWGLDEAGTSQSVVDVRYSSIQWYE